MAAVFGAVLAVAVVPSCAESSVAPKVLAPAPELVSLAEITVERFWYPIDERPGSPADTGQNWADLYLPAGPQRIDSIPLVVLIHGGAWQSTLGANVFDGLARELAGRGFAVYNVEYRRIGSGGGWPNTFRDVAHALDNIIEVDRKYPQLTTDDELVVGHSAGAQLAVWAGTRKNLKANEEGARPVFRPTRVISLAGPLDMVYAANHGDDHIVTVLGGRPSEVPDRYASVDPIQNIDPTVPVIALHGTRDTVVAPANSQRYVAAVKQRGGRAAVELLPGDTHTSIVSARSPNYQHVLHVITTTSQAELATLLKE
ncbi:alpha/beta hydrolase [Mycobacterium dioxanotrophicus]|uniref:Alpha/beta hydrolase n=1 Tax=Mycobacterium dioxanotrophicus TaxID=482462 RepID=A0A1Y0CEV7_9MYCO|nr:alpha/beta hydrolase [Mycobacterium dioxanotrophicus]